MRIKKILVVFLSILFTFSFGSSIYSSERVYLEPSSGLIGPEDYTIDIIVDSQGEDIDGFGISMEYEGDVNFLGSTPGNITGCTESSFEFREYYGDHHFSCFIMGEAYVGTDGVLATLTFEPTGNEGANILITGDISPDYTVNFLGTYTTTTTPLGTDVTDSESEDESLPQTSLFNSLVFVMGSVLLLLPFIFNYKFSSKEKEIMTEKIRD